MCVAHGVVSGHQVAGLAMCTILFTSWLVGTTEIPCPDQRGLGQLC